jgi:hypothetical protein
MINKLHTLSFEFWIPVVSFDVLSLIHLTFRSASRWSIFANDIFQVLHRAQYSQDDSGESQVNANFVLGNTSNSRSISENSLDNTLNVTVFRGRSC